MQPQPASEPQLESEPESAGQITSLCTAAGPEFEPQEQATGPHAMRCHEACNSKHCEEHGAAGTGGIRSSRPCCGMQLACNDIWPTTLPSVHAGTGDSMPAAARAPMQLATTQACTTRLCSSHSTPAAARASMQLVTTQACATRLFSSDTMLAAAHAPM
eukprot:363360-Chlamydomonas_euryale.AAC.2